MCTSTGQLAIRPEFGRLSSRSGESLKLTANDPRHTARPLHLAAAPVASHNAIIDHGPRQILDTSCSDERLALHQLHSVENQQELSRGRRVEAVGPDPRRLLRERPGLHYQREWPLPSLCESIW